jgi:hypothetical protein
MGALRPVVSGGGGCSGGHLSSGDTAGLVRIAGERFLSGTLNALPHRQAAQGRSGGIQRGRESVLHMDRITQGDVVK